MFAGLFRTPRRVPPDLADELNSLCHANQIDFLAIPEGLRRDVGLDCGCTPHRTPFETQPR